MSIKWKHIMTAPKDGRRILLKYAEPIFADIDVVFGHWEEDKTSYQPKPHFTHDLRVQHGAKKTRNTQPAYWSEDATLDSGCAIETQCDSETASRDLTNSDPIKGPSHIEALLKAAGDALQACSLWHKGDKYRDSEDEADREAWEAHKHLVDNAIGALAEGTIAERSQATQLRYALHSLSKIASGIDLPSKHAALAIKHITCGTYVEQPIQGQEVSIDVSTGDADAQNRIFATLTGECGSDGTWLAEELSRNFYPSVPSADFNGEVLGRVVTYLSQFAEFQPCGDNSADQAFRNIADCIDKLVKADKKDAQKQNKVPNRGFDCRRIRWDACSRRFVLVVLDHPVFADCVSEAFAAKHEDRFLKADQLAAASRPAASNQVTPPGDAHMASVMRKVLGNHPTAVTVIPSTCKPKDTE